jgi:hypothetical protein
VKVREFVSNAKNAEPVRPARVADGPYDWQEFGT